MDQQQQQMNQEIPSLQSNSNRSPRMTLARLDSDSMQMPNDDMHADQTHPVTTVWPNHSTSLRSLLKTSGLYNEDLESCEKLNDLFETGNEFTLHRLLSDIGFDDIDIDMHDIVKFDPVKLLDGRSFNECFPCDLLDQISVSAGMDGEPVHLFRTTNPCPPTPVATTDDIFQIDVDQLKLEPDSTLTYAEMSTLQNFDYTPSTSNSLSQQFDFDPCTLAAFERDYDALLQPTTLVNTPSPSPITSKRTSARQSRRIASRLQSRASLASVTAASDDNSCFSPAPSESSSISTKRTKRLLSVNRATDIKTSDDLSYYLERRRKNNEASKMSRAARKQKFDEMDGQCAGYERMNVELRLKIATLEVVTANLKNGLIHSFQRKEGLNAK